MFYRVDRSIELICWFFVDDCMRAARRCWGDMKGTRRKVATMEAKFSCNECVSSWRHLPSERPSHWKYWKFNIHRSPHTLDTRFFFYYCNYVFIQENIFFSSSPFLIIIISVFSSLSHRRREQSEIEEKSGGIFFLLCSTLLLFHQISFVCIPFPNLLLDFCAFDSQHSALMSGLGEMPMSQDDFS